MASERDGLPAIRERVPHRPPAAGTTKSCTGYHRSGRSCTHGDRDRDRYRTEPSLAHAARVAVTPLTWADSEGSGARPPVIKATTPDVCVAGARAERFTCARGAGRCVRRYTFQVVNRASSEPNRLYQIQGRPAPRPVSIGPLSTDDTVNVKRQRLRSADRDRRCHRPPDDRFHRTGLQPCHPRPASGRCPAPPGCCPTGDRLCCGRGCLQVR